MTKKHFIAIAAMFKARLDDARDKPYVGTFDPAVVAIENMAYSMAEYFATINPKFDRERFLTACGV